MKNRPFKHITHLLYCFLLSLPVISILGRVIYTQSNPNAKDSYYGDTINEVSVLPYSTINVGDTIYFQNSNNIDTSTESGQVSNNYITYTDVEIIDNGSTTSAIQEKILSSVKIGIYKVVSNNYYTVYLYDSNNNSYSFSSSYTFTIKFTITGYRFSTLTIFDLYNVNPLSTRVYNDYSYMDNAFDYSISKFIQDNNLGNVDLFSWFGDIFLDTDNQTNKLYLDFVNWYLNYTLLVSSSYLIFMVLYWFTAYVRKIMDKSMNQDFGGF